MKPLLCSPTTIITLLLISTSLSLWMCSCAFELSDAEITAPLPRETGNIYGRIAFAPEGNDNVNHHFTLLKDHKPIATTQDSLGLFTFDHIPADTYALAVRYEFNGFTQHYDTLYPVTVRKDQRTFLPLTVGFSGRILTNLKHWKNAFVSISSEGNSPHCQGIVKGQVIPKLQAKIQEGHYVLSLTANNEQSKNLAKNPAPIGEIRIPLDQHGAFYSDQVPCGIYTTVVVSEWTNHDFNQSEHYFDAVVLPNDTIHLKIEYLESHAQLYNELFDDVIIDRIPYKIYTPH